LISADTYDERKIVQKIKATVKEDDLQYLAKAAVQMSIIGYGKKNYGSIRIGDNKVLLLVDLFQKYNIRYIETANAKYKEDDLSARRLIRIYRYQIQSFIEKNQKPSFLWNKYSTREKKMINTCFPGAEYLIQNKDEAKYLLETYRNMDKKLNTKFVDRLKRVLTARGIIIDHMII